jgi:hypothetical protein
MIAQDPNCKLTPHNFITRTTENLDEHRAVESITEQVRKDSRCSVNKIKPNLVPGVLESSIKLSENFVTMCVFVQKMGENGKKRD